MLTYEELLNKYNTALDEIERLKKENAELRSKFGIAESEPSFVDDNSSCGIDKYSSPYEKIKLFRSLFKGRDDVFARRWYGKTSGKSGYQPVCENEWAEGLCDKRAYKCATCPNRKLLPLSNEEIYRHLSGKDEYCRDVVGIYPMLTDETCFFICADFDGDDFEKDVSACIPTRKHIHFRKQEGRCSGIRAAFSSHIGYRAKCKRNTGLSDICSLSPFFQFLYQG